MKSNEGVRKQLTIRPANGDDASAVARIYITSWNHGFGELMPQRSVTAELVERWRRDLSEPVPQRWWVAELRGLVVGFVGVGPSRDPIDPELGELDTIAVDPSCWRTGIGRRLMAVALRHLTADGYREAVLWTLSEYDRGQKFYEAVGWRPDGGVRGEGRQVRYRYVLAV